MPRPEKLQQFNTKLPKSLRKKIKILAVTVGKTMHEVVREALEEYVEEEKRNGHHI